MSTQLAKIEKNEVAKAEPTPANDADAFEYYADTVAPRFIVGELVRFSKGDWLVGEEEIIPVDTVVVPILDGLLAGHVHWSGGKPTEQVRARRLRPEAAEARRAGRQRRGLLGGRC